MRKTITTAAIAAIVLTATAALAATTPADKCEASKNKTAGAYYSCRAKAEATAISKATMPDYSKCTAKFDDKWDGAETKGETMCPDNVLTAPMNAFLAGQAAQTALIIAGSQNIPTCGDGDVNVAGEQCDGADLDGADCASLAYAGGTLACDAACNFNASGCSCSSCPSGSAFLNGSCWLLGASPSAPGVGSCDTACATIGLTCDEPALQAVGSGGTDAQCQSALNAADPAGAPYPIHGESPSDLSSCGDASDWAGGCTLLPALEFFPGELARAIRFTHPSSGTLCEADLEGGSCATSGLRVCACNP